VKTANNTSTILYLIFGQVLRVARKVQMAFVHYPSTCSNTCIGPVSWDFPSDEP
jgi:hypothetical protein